MLAVHAIAQYARYLTRAWWDSAAMVLREKNCKRSSTPTPRATSLSLQAGVSSLEERGGCAGNIELAAFAHDCSETELKSKAFPAVEDHDNLQEKLRKPGGVWNKGQQSNRQLASIDASFIVGIQTYVAGILITVLSTVLWEVGRKKKRVVERNGLG